MRFRLTIGFTCALLLLRTAGRASEEPAPLTTRIDASLTAAARYLVQKQSADGAWRSQTYGFLKDGPSLTPLVTNTLFFLPQGGREAKTAFAKGADYLTRMVGKDGNIQTGERGLAFPVLTAATACRVLTLEKPTEQTCHAAAAWWNYLRTFQLVESLGWQPSDPEYGGWGFALDPPRKPAPGQPKPQFTESNLVATIFAIAAVRAAKTPADSPMYRQILTFAKRCQNFSDATEHAALPFDDGGFFFIPGDPLQNKAGIAGKDATGNERYRSYGSMTADGLRALLRCGLPPTHPRVVAARRWLEQNFSATKHPGAFPPEREVLGESTYFYYAWAVAHAFLALDLRTLETPHGKVIWAQDLAEALLQRQKPDGSWKNRFTASNEDDPLIATSWAASALALCRQMLPMQK